MQLRLRHTPLEDDVAPHRRRTGQRHPIGRQAGCSAARAHGTGPQPGPQSREDRIVAGRIRGAAVEAARHVDGDARRRRRPAIADGAADALDAAGQLDGVDRADWRDGLRRGHRGRAREPHCRARDRRRSKDARSALQRSGQCTTRRISAGRRGGPRPVQESTRDAAAPRPAPAPARPAGRDALLPGHSGGRSRAGPGPLLRPRPGAPRRPGCEGPRAARSRMKRTVTRFTSVGHAPAKCGGGICTPSRQSQR